MTKILYQSTKDGNLISTTDQKLLQVWAAELKDQSGGSRNVLEVTLESGKQLRISRKKIDEAAYSFGPAATGRTGKGKAKEKKPPKKWKGYLEREEEKRKGPANDVDVRPETLKAAIDIYLEKITRGEAELLELKKLVNYMLQDIDLPPKFLEAIQEG